MVVHAQVNQAITVTAEASAFGHHQHSCRLLAAPVTPGSLRCCQRREEPVSQRAVALLKRLSHRRQHLRPD
jgi:hypothetical protein